MIDESKMALEHDGKPIMRGNFFGEGGQSTIHKFIPWHEFIDQGTEYDTIKREHIPIHSYLLAYEEHMFFGFFGPLEDWCEKNCKNEFGLYTTNPHSKIKALNSGVHLFFHCNLDYSNFVSKHEGSMYITNK